MNSSFITSRPGTIVTLTPLVPALLFKRSDVLREMVVLLCFLPGVLLIVVYIFLTVPRVGLQCVIMVFSDNTHQFFVRCRSIKR